jgi:hypothetical protein
MLFVENIERPVHLQNEVLSTSRMAAEIGTMLLWMLCGHAETARDALGTGWHVRRVLS